MTLQGRILPDGVPVNNYELTVVGLASPIFFVEISGIELEVQTTDLPDRTKASGGQFLPQEWTAMTMLHHSTERAALEVWLLEAQEPVTATYKKSATLIHKTLSGANNGVYLLSGVFISKRKLPDLDRSNEGEHAQIEWTFNSDSIEEQ